jgi:hypothetical protein
MQRRGPSGSTLWAASRRRLHHWTVRWLTIFRCHRPGRSVSGNSHGAARAGLARHFTRARQTPNPAFCDWGRSARLGPSPRRRGSQSCGKPQAGARRPCSHDPPGERSPHLRAVAGPIRHRGSALSAGGASVSDHASRPRGRPHNSSRLSSRRTGLAPRCRATRPL